MIIYIHLLIGEAGAGHPRYLPSRSAESASHVPGGPAWKVVRCMVFAAPGFDPFPYQPQ